MGTRRHFFLPRLRLHRRRQLRHPWITRRSFKAATCGDEF